MAPLTEAAVEELARRVLALRDDVEFRTFWLGTRVRGPIQKADAIALRHEANHRVGLRVLEVNGDLAPTPERPEARIMLRLDTPAADIRVRPILLYGRYLKHSRRIPQSKWPCRRCRGRGCPICNFTGKRFQTSVEEMLGGILLPRARARGTKLHSVGREDVDARMLGEGRPFVLELIEPRTRIFDIADVEEIFRQQYGREAEIRELQFADNALLDAVNSLAPDKTYRAVVACLAPVPRAAFAALRTLEGATVRQETPRRVLHRRSNLIRERGVRKIGVELPAKGDSVIEFSITLRVESGTYIKELVSGDEGRTCSSVAQLLDRPCECVALDVMAVHCDPLAAARANAAGV